MTSTIVPSDLIINESLAKKLVEDQFGIQVNKNVVACEGFDNTVYLINDSLVFRFPRRKIAIELIELELRLFAGSGKFAAPSYSPAKIYRHAKFCI